MSSDTSDEENLDLLKEAADPTFFKNHLYDGRGQSLVTKEKIDAKPSLRYKNDDDQFRVYNVTPQFQQYISNLLSAKLEKYLENNLSECFEKKRKKKIPNSVRLFKTSKYPIEIDSVHIEIPIMIKSVKPKVKKKELISESEFKSIIVSGDDILRKKGVEHWSNRSKAPVYRYTKNKEGVLSYIQAEFK